MSKRLVTLRKAILLLSMGGTTFIFFGGFGGDLGCVRNDDLVAFYQDVGGAGIQTFADNTRAAIGDECFDDWVITPTQGLFTAMWNNFVAQDFPLDVEPITANVLRQ